MKPTDIATLKPGDPLIWRVPGKRYSKTVHYLGPSVSGRILVSDDAAATIRTVSVRNCTRPAPAPTPEASCSPS